MMPHTSLLSPPASSVTTFLVTRDKWYEPRWLYLSLKILLKESNLEVVEHIVQLRILVDVLELMIVVLCHGADLDPVVWIDHYQIAQEQKTYFKCVSINLALD